MAYVDMSSGGGNVKTGTFISPTRGNTITITCEFEPKKIYLTMYESSSIFYVVAYDIDMDSTHQIAGWSISSSSKDCVVYAFPNSTNNGVLVSISSTGFVYKAGTTTAGKTVYYTVIG